MEGGQVWRASSKVVRQTSAQQGSGGLSRAEAEVAKERTKCWLIGRETEFGYIWDEAPAQGKGTSEALCQHLGLQGYVTGYSKPTGSQHAGWMTSRIGQVLQDCVSTMCLSMRSWHQATR